MRSKTVRVDDLIQDPNNARLHPAASIEAIQASLAAFEQEGHIVVTEPDAEGKMLVLAGNGRLVAAKRLGWDKLTAVVSDLKGPEARAYAIADNQTGLLSSFDSERLASELAVIPDDLIEAIGFSDADLAELCGVVPCVDDATPPDVAEFDAYSVRVEGIREADFSDVMAIVADVLSSYELKAESH